MLLSDHVDTLALLASLKNNFVETRPPRKKRQFIHVLKDPVHFNRWPLHPVQGIPNLFDKKKVDLWWENHVPCLFVCFFGGGSHDSDTDVKQIWLWSLIGGFTSKVVGAHESQLIFDAHQRVPS